MSLSHPPLASFPPDHHGQSVKALCPLQNILEVGHIHTYFSLAWCGIQCGVGRLDPDNAELAHRETVTLMHGSIYKTVVEEKRRSHWGDRMSHTDREMSSRTGKALHVALSGGGGQQ